MWVGARARARDFDVPSYSQKKHITGREMGFGVKTDIELKSAMSWR